MTVNHTVKVHPSSAKLPREEQLAWKIAEVAADPVEVSAEVTDMVINRVLDNASVAMASVIKKSSGGFGSEDCELLSVAAAEQLGVAVSGDGEQCVCSTLDSLHVGPFLPSPSLH